MSNAHLYEPLTAEELQEEMRKILNDELIPTAMEKGNDYTGSQHNVDTLDNVGRTLGWVGAWTRGQDKNARVKTVVEGIDLQVKDESMENSFLDLLNYAFYQLILYRRRKCDIKVITVPLEGDDLTG